MIVLKRNDKLKDLISGLPIGSKVSVILTDGSVWQHSREGFLSDEFGVDWAKATAEARYGRDGRVDEYWGCQIQYNAEELPFISN